jgi:pimeloyl-ACP methyl ester carboxylesterase
MGPQVAELVARIRPRQIAGLVLLTPVPLGGLGVPEDAAIALRKSGGNPEVQRELRIKFSSHLTAAELDYTVEAGAKVRPQTSATLFEAWSGGHDAGQVPSVVNVPVLIISGADDPFVTRELLITAIFPRFSRARSAFISSAGHWPHLEQPVAVARLVQLKL